MKVSNRVYDIIKLISLVILPLADFTAALATIWGWGDIGIKVVATLTALDTLLGALTVILKSIYDKDQAKLEGGK